MGVAQYVHLSAIAMGIILALCARWFALIFVSPLFLIVSAGTLWFAGYPLATVIGSAFSDVVLLQFSFFLTFVVLSRISIKRRQQSTGQEHTVIDSKRLPVF